MLTVLTANEEDKILCLNNSMWCQLRESSTPLLERPFDERLPVGWNVGTAAPVNEKVNQR